MIMKLDKRMSDIFLRNKYYPHIIIGMDNTYIGIKIDRYNALSLTDKTLYYHWYCDDLGKPTSTIGMFTLDKKRGCHCRCHLTSKDTAYTFILDAYNSLSK